MVTVLKTRLDAETGCFQSHQLPAPMAAVLEARSGGGTGLGDLQGTNLGGASPLVSCLGRYLEAQSLPL